MIALDASAVLALLRAEPGADEVRTFIDGAVMSAVNLSEVLQKSVQVGVDPQAVARLLAEAGIDTVSFDEQMAVAAAGLWSTTRAHGLSFADRACLALASAVHGIAVTTDTAWGDLDLPGIDVHVITRA